MNPVTILLIIGAYFLLLLSVSHITGKGAKDQDFFLAGRKSPWFLVAFGMIGASLSGVTFISIPGVIGGEGGNMAFSYMQMVLGYLVGYLVIALVLMPIYYKQQLTSIYGYLENRFGHNSYKTGAAYFLLSRVIGASFRLFLVALVMHEFILKSFGISFELTVLITILLIWVYTFRGGIKTIVWTDTLQTTFMLAAVILTILGIGKALNTDISGMVNLIQESNYSQWFFFEGGWQDPNNFFKQFISGALIAIVMTGLDQDMMQKNLSCKTLASAQKNVYSFSIILFFANILFLSLGALLYIYAAKEGIEIPERTDHLFPIIALNHLGGGVGILFILGLIAAAYSSADSALTALTTSFCVDFLNFEKREDESFTQGKKRTRFMVHIGFSVLIFIMIIIFNLINDDAVINKLFLAAGYTYGPILGLFTFGIFTKMKIKDSLVIPICIISPVLSYFINSNSETLFNGFQFGFLIILLNGFLTFMGLLLIAQKRSSHQ